MVGSHSMAVSSAARSTAGAEVMPPPDKHSPTTTSYPASRSHSIANSARCDHGSETPAEDAVMPMRAPGARGAGYLIMASSVAAGRPDVPLILHRESVGGRCLDGYDEVVALTSLRVWSATDGAFAYAPRYAAAGCHAGTPASPVPLRRPRRVPSG